MKELGFIATGARDRKKAGEIKVIRGLPDGLTEQAIKAARGLQFVPAMKDGMAVSIRSNIEYQFTMGEEHLRRVLRLRPGEAVADVDLLSDSELIRCIGSADARLFSARDPY